MSRKKKSTEAIEFYRAFASRIVEPRIVRRTGTRVEIYNEARDLNDDDFYITWAIVKHITDLVQTIRTGGYDQIRDREIAPCSLPRRAIMKIMYDVFSAAVDVLQERAHKLDLDEKFYLSHGAHICWELLEKGVLNGSSWPYCLPDERYALMPPWKQREVAESARILDLLIDARRVRTANTNGRRKIVHPTDEARKRRVEDVVNDLGKGENGFHASIKTIIKELKNRRMGQRCATTRAILRELHDEGKYLNPNM